MTPDRPDPNATVTISLDGLLLSGLNDDDEFEIGVVKHPDHVLSMDILKLSPDGIELLNHGLDLSSPIIEVRLEEPEGASLYQPGERFERRGYSNDPQDFRWVPDFNNTDDFPGDAFVFCGLEQCIRFTDGLFYTMALTTNELMRQDFSNSSTSSDPFGYIADITGGNINFDAGRLLVKAGGKTFRLDYDADTRYFIAIKNTRIPGSTGHTTGTDFLMYYTHVHDHDAHKYDLFDPHLDRGVPPQNCDGAHVGGGGGLIFTASAE
jgi:hypothetical protein